MSVRRYKWWGWGDVNKRYSLADQTSLISYIESEIGDLEKPAPHVSIDTIELPPSDLTDDDVRQIEEIVGRQWIRVDNTTRIIYSFGKSYKDLICLRNGMVDLATDGVVFPKNESEIEEILIWAVDTDVSIIPFGGGTSVVGGVERSELSSKTVTVSLERLSNVSEIDETSLTSRCQAGILGPELEGILKEAGFSLGHFPESFEFSTLGGWIATRGAGQASTKYGKIEDLVQSVRVVTPTGVVESGPFPAQATGGDLLQSIIGSEGTLGIITEAVVRIHRLPEVSDTRGYLFDDFVKGVEAIREMLQTNISPAIVRLSDVKETTVSLKFHEFEKGKVDLKQRLGELYLRLKGRSLRNSCLLILGFEGRKNEVKYTRKLAGKIIQTWDGVSLGKSAGRSWQKRRFEHPYLRDELINFGVLVDTLETSTTWSNLLSLYQVVVSTFDDSFTSMGTKGKVLTHLSHAYRDGASLYFTFLLPAKRGKEIDQWQKIKSEAIDVILKNGGSLSHHHGVGKDHIRWMETFLGEKSVDMLRGIKNQLDPSNIMNPGTLIAPTWWKQPRKVTTEEFSSRTREKNLHKLDNESFDLLVIGGGITGAGIAWDATLRGMKVALIEKGDFGSGTSSKSSKMIHGGLRYLKQLNVKLVRESLHERGLLLKLAPHLVHPVPHVIPIYGHAALKMMELRVGLTGYDILAGSLNIAKHEKLTREEVIDRVPCLNKEGLKGGFLYYDCLVNDARLTLSVILSIFQAGAVVANYVKARRTISEDGLISGIEYEDVLTGKQGMIRATVVISAAGPWTDEVRHMAGGKGKRLRPTKGIHLIFSQKRLPSNDVVLLFAADGRPLYLVPIGDCCYVGTTDTDYHESLDDIRATSEDVKYVLETIRSYFPLQGIEPDDILGYWAGVRPLVAMEGKTSRISRDYVIDHEPSGLVVVAGGKLTTFRAMAEKVIDEILERYGKRFKHKFKKCQTDVTKLVGGEVEDMESYRKIVLRDLSLSYPVESNVLDQLISTYGTKFLTILGYGLLDSSLLKPIYAGSRTTIGEILNAIDSEMAVTLEDFMERRSGMKYFSPDHGLHAVNRIARIMGNRLGWSFSERRDQVKRYMNSIEMMMGFERDTDESSHQMKMLNDCK